MLAGLLATVWTFGGDAARAEQLGGGIDHTRQLERFDLELEPAARREFLAAACGADAELLAAAKSLLRAAGTESGILDEPVRAALVESAHGVEQPPVAA